MTRALSRTVVAGGVVYPAGTPAAPDLEERITNPAYWSGETKKAVDADAPEAKPKRARKPAGSEPKES